MEPPVILVKAVMEEMGIRFNTYFLPKDLKKLDEVVHLLCFYRAAVAIQLMKEKPTPGFVIKRLRQVAHVLGWEFIRKEVTHGSKRTTKYIVNEKVKEGENEGVEKEILVGFK